MADCCPTCRPALINNPSIPFKYNLLSLHYGTIIHVKGIVASNADRFVINFETADGDVAYHFNVRIDSNCVVKTCKIGGCYQEEERDHTLNLYPNEPFEIFFLADKEEFKASINGTVVASYQHHISLTEIQTLHIYENGSAADFLTIEYVHIQPYIGPSPISGGCEPCLNPPVPFSAKIPGTFGAGRRIRIVGKPIGDRFHINFHRGYEMPSQNMALHFDVRFNENVVVRNTFDGSWGSEERGQTNFPFVKGELFEVEIKVEPTHYHFLVNGVHYATYNHRMEPLHSIDTLNIFGKVVIHEIFFL